MRVSRYNFAIPSPSGVALYNALSGAAMLVDGSDCREVAAALTKPREFVTARSYDPEFWSDLVSAGFVVEEADDELETVRERFKQARSSTPMVLTLTTTLDCNLGCYYCYEDRSTQQLELSDVHSIVDLTRSRLRKYGKRSLHVDWYGGEPLLNHDFLEAASLALQDMCRSEGVGYEASIISNGTRWPSDVADFVRRHKIVQAQISFDGGSRNHNLRRRFRKGYEPEDAPTSFDRCLAVVDRLVQVTRVDVRLNVDRGNRSDFGDFIDLARERGWFRAPYPVVIQPARLSNYSEKSEFMRRKQLRPDEFDEVRRVVEGRLNGEAPIEDGRNPDGWARPRMSVCAALADASIVVGADSRLFRCGLQVSEPQRSVGSVPTRSGLTPLRMADKTSEQGWWDAFDPTVLPKCSRCSFLPLCWGGCPKRHLEMDTEAADEQGLFWRKNLPFLVGNMLDIQVDGDYEISHGEQFRFGLTAS